MKYLIFALLISGCSRSPVIVRISTCEKETICVEGNGCAEVINGPDGRVGDIDDLKRAE